MGMRLAVKRVWEPDYVHVQCQMGSGMDSWEMTRLVTCKSRDMIYPHLPELFQAADRTSRCCQSL